MIGVYDYTVLLTYISLLSGIYGIISASNGNLFTAIICLMFSGLCDMFDGRVARTKKKRTIEERHFGVQLDSLADVICFGVLPAMIGYSLGTPTIIVMLFPLAGLIRLAWFNVLEITRNSSTPVKEYTGLPITSSALIFPLIYVFNDLLGSKFYILYSVVLSIVGILFISKIKIKKPGLKTMIGFIVVGIIEMILIVMVRNLL